MDRRPDQHETQAATGFGDARSTSGPVQRLGSALGYGESLHDSLVDYWKNVGDPEYRSQLEDGYAAWLRDSGVAEVVCFADITFYPPGQAERATTLLIAPSKNAQDAYRKALRAYLESKHTMAPHAVFRAGLPLVAGSGGEWHLATPEQIRNREPVLGDGVLHCVLRSRSCAGEVDQTRPEGRFLAGVIDTYERTDIPLLERVSSYPLLDQWGAWVEEFSKRPESLCSGRAQPLGRLLAFPVGFRPLAREASYELVACVFLGLDAACGPSEEKEAIRYFLLHILHANLLGEARILAGRQEATRLFASHEHEALRVIRLIGKTRNPSVLETIRNWLITLYVEDNPLDGEKRAFLERAGRDWKTLLNHGLRTAAALEALMWLSQSKQDTSLIEPELEGEIDRVVGLAQLATAPMPMSDPEKVFPTLWAAFRAVVAAIRNAIQHGVYSERQRSSGEPAVLRMEISTREGVRVLRVINEGHVRTATLNMLEDEGRSLTREERVALLAEQYSLKPRSALRDKGRGSLSTLHAFVSRYAPHELRLVFIRCVPGRWVADGHVFTWITELPLPTSRSD